MGILLSQMKKLQLTTEGFAEGIGGRACKGPDDTSSTLSLPSLVPELSASPAAYFKGSHPENMLHLTLGTCPSCHHDLQPCRAMEAPKPGAV